MAASGWGNDIYSPGEETEWFPDYESLKEAAIKKWREVFPNTNILLEGRLCCWSVQEALDGNDKDGIVCESLP